MTIVYAIGSNGSGQLGVGHKEDISVPKPVLTSEIDPLELASTSQVRAGGNHTLILSSGVLYGCGDTASGALGVLSDGERVSDHFYQFRFPEDSTLSRRRVVLSATCWESSIIIQQDEDGFARLVYTFGTGSKGELGQGELLFRTSKAQLIKNFPPLGLEVVDLASSVSHVVAVMSNGSAYGWGNGRKGQLGYPEDMIYAPRLISGLDFKVTRAVCGREFTYLVGDAAQGQSAVLGSDKWGVRSSAPLGMIGWKDIGASWGSIYVLQKDGKLLSWGRDDHGQLAPPDLPPLSHIAVGSEHALGLTEGGDVLAWGWGEHGNCGPDTVNGDVSGKWNVIASKEFLPPGKSISGIGAGCATSWVLIGP